MSTINIFFNGQPQRVEHGLTLEQAMHRFSESDAAAGAPIASALNGQYVAKQSRAQTILVDQDSITTFEPITGG